MNSKSIYKLFSLAGSSPFYFLVLLATWVFSHGVALRLLLSFVGLMVICYSIKLIYRKPRPDALERPAGKSWFSWLDAASFPSVHSARAAALSVCIGIGLATINLTIPAILLGVFFVACVGLSRIKLRRHFFTDVIGGALTGAVIAFAAFKTTAIIVPWLQRMIRF
jgi:membrane-associated phospholipid phosphatase